MPSGFADHAPKQAHGGCFPAASSRAISAVKTTSNIAAATAGHGVAICTAVNAPITISIQGTSTTTGPRTPRPAACAGHDGPAATFDAPAITNAAPTMTPAIDAAVLNCSLMGSLDGAHSIANREPSRAANTLTTPPHSCAADSISSIASSEWVGSWWNNPRLRTPHS